jgi:perosamine synthetase
MERLASAGIDCRPFFHPLSSLPAYAGSPQAEVARSRNRVCYAISPCGINLPSALNLTREQVAHVSQQLRALLSTASCRNGPLPAPQLR